MLTVSAEKRATIRDICAHYWVNEGFAEECLNEAEHLSSLTPVRLDLLLSLAPAQKPQEISATGEEGTKDLEEEGGSGSCGGAAGSGAAVIQEAEEVSIVVRYFFLSSFEHLT